MRAFLRFSEIFDAKMVRTFPGALEFISNPLHGILIVLRLQGLHQAKESTRVTRIPAQTLSEYRYSLLCVARSEKRRAQRLANGVVPGKRFVIG
jgi:hypothetical protein